MSEIEPRFWMFDDGEYGVELYKERSQPDMEPLYDESALAQARAEMKERCARICEESHLKFENAALSEGAAIGLQHGADRIRALSDKQEDRR